MLVAIDLEFVHDELCKIQSQTMLALQDWNNVSQYLKDSLKDVEEHKEVRRASMFELSHDLALLFIDDCRCKCPGGNGRNSCP